MSELWKLVQEHLDEYGVREAALARRMGVPPQTLNSMKKRKMKQLPDRTTIEALAREIRQPYERVLGAILSDLQYADEAQLGRIADGIKFSVDDRRPDGLLGVVATNADGSELDPVSEELAQRAMAMDPAILATTLVLHLSATEPGVLKGIGDTPEQVLAHFQRLFENPDEVTDFLSRFVQEDDHDDNPPTKQAGVSPARDALELAAKRGRRERTYDDQS